MIDPRDEGSRERLASALGARRWVEEVAAGGPYDSVDALVDAGARAARTLSDEELDEALDHAAAEQRSDASAQAGLGRLEEGDDAAVARGAEVYRQRFGRRFLLVADGRPQQEVLDELQRRLKNPPDVEAVEAKDELRAIARQRLEVLFGGG